MTVRTGAGMQRGRSHSVRAWVAVAAAAALTLSGCDLGGDGEDEDVVTQTSDAAPDGEGGPDDDGNGGPIEPPSEPADIQPVAGDRSASSSGGSITISGDRASFVTPTGNIACTVNSRTAICQIDDKTYTPREGQLVVDTIGGCSLGDADAMMIATRGAWTCPPQPILAQTTVNNGGWWIDEVDGQTQEVDGTQAAVLPYGNSLTVGAITCVSGENGVSCSSSDLGRSFFIASGSYSFG